MGDVHSIWENCEHQRGEAVCSTCGHVWEHVERVEVLTFLCPECGAYAGMMRHAFEPDVPLLACARCHGMIFWVLTNGEVMCRKCGNQGTPPVDPGPGTG